jgi:hypothetical protein
MPSAPGANVSQSSHPDIPTMDDLIAHYEKVLSELDEVMSELTGAISTQRDFVPGAEITTPWRGRDSSNVTNTSREN